MERIDHVIIKADDLHAVVKDFKNAGFDVYYGSKKEKAYNAIVYLQDDSFLELLNTALVPPFARFLTKVGFFKVTSPFFNRLGNFYFKQGPLLDYPVFSSNIEEFHAKVKGRVSKLKTNAERTKPNGVTVRFKCFMPKNLDFPFVKSAYLPETMSPDETNHHPNGIQGMKNLKIGVSSGLDQFRKDLIAFYDIEEKDLGTRETGFDVKTANATISYVASPVTTLKCLQLYPYNKEVNDKLGKYGITTANW